ncbi:hypothetical protein [Halorhabdus sp. BNX81]|uniref:hypothetical protein n=1 Tax=Halorhabdus sp. BNX81 TaxID=2980181 RepID=UPI0023DD1A17|nr:hypothetical protein [Halorhabdus sp. BNX81]
MAVRHRVRQSLEIETPRYGVLVLLMGVIWGIGDTFSTVLAANVTGSLASEINPLLRLLLAVDPFAVVFLKGAVALYASFVLLACREQVKQVPGWRLWFFGMIGAGMVIVAQNLSVVFVTI